MSDKVSPDWEAIEREYRAGQFSTREIARRYDLSEAAIRKKAKQFNWYRPLAKAVRKATDEKLVRIDSALANHANPARDQEIIEAASERSVKVVITHRNDLNRMRRIAETLSTRLEQHLSGDEIAGPFLGERESLGDLMEKLSRTMERLIRSERQAHNLDVDTAEKDEASDGGQFAKLAEALDGLASSRKGGASGAG
jgi:replicative superfamily II helicase